MLIFHKKLVRDKIPMIIENNGQTAKTRILDKQHYTRALEKKLKEETREYLHSRDLTELADILEVVDALAADQGSSFEQIVKLKQKKRQTNGAFHRKIFLVSVKK